MDHYELPQLFAQRPAGHNYFELNGRATIRIGGEDRLVAPGTVVYVPGGVEHRFHTIAEELQVLVVFAPAETAPAS